MIQAEPVTDSEFGLPAQPNNASGSFRSNTFAVVDEIGVALGFNGEGPMRRIVGIAVVLLAVSLLGWFLYKRRRT